LTNIFVTGGSGFIGSHLCKKLSENHTVITLTRDIIPSLWLNNALSSSIKVQGDIRNFKLLKRVITHYEVSHVVHLAALAKVKTAFKDPLNVYETNIMGTVNVLEACRQADVEKVLVLITDKIFGEKLNAKENDSVQPSEPYATSKASADLISESYRKTYGLNVIHMRSCNVYGLDLHSNRIVPNTVKKCLRGEQPVIFKGETETVRQYIYINDVVDAIIKLINNYSYGAFNVCTKDLLNQADVVYEILKHFPNLKPKYVKRKAPPEIKRQSMVLTDFGWKPKYSFAEGIKLTIDEFKKWWLKWQ